ncbi:hypothetical protein FNF28_06324 [Cafeteria roenbergensis]|uniref:DUF3592 domain-containing protein n=1 Tax=Cafeteria roenbergensis TaxID=33653 RepID=A0A5A8CZL5_CAFRO|nr:hypothetical protein FNF28_06324 [Cafeteria roenbergensis]
MARTVPQWLASAVALGVLLAGAGTARAQDEPANEPLPVFAPAIPLVFCAIATLMGAAIFVGRRTAKAQAEAFKADGVKSTGLVTGKRVETRSSGDHSRAHFFLTMTFDAALPSGEATGVTGEFEVGFEEHRSATERVTRMEVLYNRTDPRHAAVAAKVEESLKPGAGRSPIACCGACLIIFFFLVGLGACIGLLFSVPASDVGAAAGIAAAAAVVVVGACAAAGVACGRRARFGALGELTPPSAIASRSGV